MAMVVQHNLTAMNANRQLGVTTGSQAKSSEKLSSGYRINRAGDDAAGLKISEKMRSQVRGLNKASSNAQDGVSLIQTAEGALNEAHSILQRMNELAVQGANDTNETIDRDAINQELDALTEELDRIASTTQFNKQNLLDGSFQNKNLQVGANSGQKIEISINEMNASALGLKGMTHIIPGGEGQDGQKIVGAKYELSALNMELSMKISNDWNSVASMASATVSDFKNQISDALGSTNYAPQVSGASANFYKSLIKGDGYGTAASAMSADMSDIAATLSDGITSATFGTYASKEDVVASAVTSQLSTTGNIAVDTYDMANKSIDLVQNAINLVSNQRSALGALQNRLEHTIANLDNVAENTQAAESRIRDTDMASEMVEYSKNNILAQAGQSMLAQSNQSTQGVLSLLQ